MIVIDEFLKVCCGIPPNTFKKRPFDIKLFGGKICPPRPYFARMVGLFGVVASYGRPFITFTMNKRIHVYYSGYVQGIGFRYTVERVAGSLGLAGWVKNLDDGRVEAVCEGETTRLKEFLQKINGALKDYIKDTDLEWSAATGEFKNFNIRF